MKGQRKLKSYQKSKTKTKKTIQKKEKKIKIKEIMMIIKMNVMKEKPVEVKMKDNKKMNLLLREN